MKVSQALFSEFVIASLLRKLMLSVIENAGAQKGFLILNREGQLIKTAASEVEPIKVEVLQSTSVDNDEQLPVSIINYVARTLENVVVNNATTESKFTDDPYIQLHQPKSVLVVPIISEDKLIGIFYLENNQTTEAFTPERLEMLTIISAQAAISIENALLYEQLENYSHSLEVKVEERAQELKNKNEQLEQTLQQLKVAQKQMLAQEKLASLGALIAGVAHEIRNPLNFVNNFAELSANLAQELQQEIGNQCQYLDAGVVESIKDILSDLVENVIEIKRQSQRVDKIIQTMLIHAHHESSKREMTDINGLIASSIKLVFHNLRQKYKNFNISIETNYDASIGQVEIVPQDINRAFINIINNACYAAHTKKKMLGEEFSPIVSVKTNNLGESVEISIQDNGLGISKNVLDKIFTPFFTTKPPGEGTGLGLSLTHDIIVGQHQGEMKLETEPGVYTKFIMVLPKKAV